MAILDRNRSEDPVPATSESDRDHFEHLNGTILGHGDVGVEALDLHAPTLRIGSGCDGPDREEQEKRERNESTKREGAHGQSPAASSGPASSRSKLTLGAARSGSATWKNSFSPKPNVLATRFEGTCAILVL